MEQRVRNASNDYQAAGRFRWGDSGLGGRMALVKVFGSKGGGMVFFLEKASTYAASPLLFLCCFVWSCSFLHMEKRLHNSICLGTGKHILLFTLWLAIANSITLWFSKLIDPPSPPPHIIITRSNAKSNSTVHI